MKKLNENIENMSLVQQYEKLKNKAIVNEDTPSETDGDADILTKDKNDIKVLILTNENKEANDKLFRTASRFKEECDKAKIPNFVAFVEKTYIVKNKDSYEIFNLGDKKGFIFSDDNTVALIRGSIARFKSTLDLISQLEKAGVFCINYRQTMEECSDKYRTVLKLVDAGLPCPKTALVQNEDMIDFALETIGNKFPIVVKTLTGSKGIGVFFAESHKSLKSVLQTIWKLNEETELLVQEYIETDADIRVHVLKNKVIAAMRRDVISGDFRSNFSLGGKVKEVELDDETAELCIKASKAVGATWSGVDLILTKKNKPIFIEVNSSPGTEGIESATGDNIIKIVLDFLKNKENWDKKAIECGVKETINIVGIGEFESKFDTGNGSLCVIHADEYEIKDKKVTWKTNGKEYTHKFKKIKDVHVGGLRDHTEKRPVIELDVEFNGTVFKEVDFTLSNRETRTAVLINKKFMRKANLAINPAKTYILSIPIEEKNGKD